MFSNSNRVLYAVLAGCLAVCASAVAGDYNDARDDLIQRVLREDSAILDELATKGEQSLAEARAVRASGVQAQAPVTAAEPAPAASATSAGARTKSGLVQFMVSHQGFDVEVQVYQTRRATYFDFHEPVRFGSCKEAFRVFGKDHKDARFRPFTWVQLSSGLNEVDRGACQERLIKENRFLDEIRAHENTIGLIRKIDEIFSKGEVTVLILEYFDTDLYYWNNLQGHYSNIEYFKRLNLYYQLTQGLQWIKRIGFIHADPKPENILIREDGEIVTSVYADFDLSWIPREVVGRKKLGSFGYASPEVLSFGGESVPRIHWDKQDVFSHSVVGYLLFVGIPPWMEVLTSGVPPREIWGMYQASLAPYLSISSTKDGLWGEVWGHEKNFSSMKFLLQKGMDANPVSRIDANEFFNGFQYVRTKATVGTWVRPRENILEALQQFPGFFRDPNLNATELLRDSKSGTYILQPARPDPSQPYEGLQLSYVTPYGAVLEVFLDVDPAYLHQVAQEIVFLKIIRVLKEPYWTWGQYLPWNPLGLFGAQ